MPGDAVRRLQIRDIISTYHPLASEPLSAKIPARDELPNSAFTNPQLFRCFGYCHHIHINNTTAFGTCIYVITTDIGSNGFVPEGLPRTKDSVLPATARTTPLLQHADHYAVNAE
jgi:hypothetical protein